jgi:Ser/Thr protein kinase RdoA (MazF antagonist)
MRFEALVKWWLKASYDCSDVRCEFIERPTGTIVHVETLDESYYLRLATGTARTIEETEDEAHAVATLHRRGLRVAPPVHRRDGAYAGAFPAPAGSCAAVLFHKARGMAVERPTRQQAQALGTLIAEIHTAGRELRLPSRPRLDGEYLAVAPVRHTEYWLRKHGLNVGRVLAIAEEMQAAIWQINALESGFCHGDVHLGSVRFVDVGPTIFDFDSCGVGPCVYDVACYWRKHVFGAVDPGHAARVWKEFLVGYGSVRSLNDRELAMVPVLATLRAIWVMALPALPGAKWGEDWLWGTLRTSKRTLIRSRALLKEPVKTDREQTC